MAERYTDGIRYDACVVGASAKEMQFPPRWVPVPFPRNPLWARLGNLFDPEHFLYPCPPVELGAVEIDTAGMERTRVLRCPIKRSGSDVLHLPSELAALEGVVRHVGEMEVAVTSSPA